MARTIAAYLKHCQAGISENLFLTNIVKPSRVLGMNRDIDFTDDLLDLRDIAERLQELAEQAADPDESLDDDEIAELEELQEFAQAFVGDMGGAVIGEYAEDEPTLIADRYFVTYAQELAEDCGMIPSDLGWPCTHIDWNAAAEDLKQDYSCIDYNGRTYWIGSY